MMKLRQIVRDQKLINFDYKLKGFISEADDEKVDPKDAFAGMTKAKNPSKKYWYVKDGKYKAVVDPPKEGGWELADKKKAEKEKKGAKEATQWHIPRFKKLEEMSHAHVEVEKNIKNATEV